MIVPSREELIQIFQAIGLNEPFGARDRAVIVLFANTGLRVSELSGLDVHHVVGADQVVREQLDVCRQWAKGGHVRRIPLNAAARKAIRQLLAFNEARGFSTERGAPLVQDRFHRRIPVRSIQRMLQKYRERAQASDRITPHTLRHYTADRAVHRGANPRFVQVLLGHKRLETVQVYTRATAADLRQAVGP